MEKSSVPPSYNHANQSQEFSRSSVAFYPSPSSLIGDSDKLSNKSSSSISSSSSFSFKSPYDIEENQFNCLFNNDNDDYNKDNNLRNDSQTKKMMDSNSLIKQKYVTFILDHEGKSRNPKETSSTNKLSSSDNNQRNSASHFLNRHETFEEAESKILHGENKSLNNVQTRYSKTSNIDQRSARKCFLHPSAASTGNLNRKLATAKASQRKKDNFLGNSMHVYVPNSKSETQSVDNVAKKSPVGSIIIENLY